MRYDSEEYLQAFRLQRTFPKIHDKLYAFVVARTARDPFCDLCCSTGLFGQRLEDNGYHGFGIDASMDALIKGRSAGVTLPMIGMKITYDTLVPLRERLKENCTKILIARRCLPEILGAQNFGAELGYVLRQAGVRQVFLQGRQVTHHPRNPLHTLELEIAALKGWARASDWQEDVPGCAHLVPT